MRLAITQSFQQPLTASVFPLTEKLLEDPECYAAVYGWLGEDNVSRYASLMDCLFCTIFPEYREVCFEYYNGVGNSLKSIISSKTIELLDISLEKLIKSHSVLLVTYKIKRLI